MTHPAETDRSSTLKRALLAIDQLKRELDAARQARSEPIAIVGIGCRFPGGVTDAESYWRLLAAGSDAISEVPRDRWDVDALYGGADVQPGKTTTRWGGFLEHIDEFDCGFFGISPREAIAMDPQQRLVLEVAWEALENAGQAQLAGSRSGVFVGAVSNDYGIEKFSHPLDLSAYAATGTAHSVISGRLAFTLDLRGPAVSIDTACSSSLVAVHLACQSLRAGDCDLAVAGGVNAILSPLPTIAFSQFGMMSPDGRCRTFDAGANGFVRGEGCGMVVLKRLSDAVAAGDDVLAVIRGSAINQDGRGTGLTAPNVLSQRALIRRALELSSVDPHQVSYVEAHGTGTPIGDPIEVEALSDVYRAERGAPWHLGSVKTNFGHLEAAAGIAGLIKVVLGLRHHAIPAHLHFERLNPHIAVEHPPFAIPTRLTDWAPRAGRRIAGVSSFGLSGTNVHMIVEEGPARTPPREALHRPISILALSAKTDTALRELARRYRDQLTRDPEVAIADLCFSANTGRAQLRHRLAVVGGSRQELDDQLAAFAASDAPAARATEPRKPAVGFLFPGRGVSPGTARALHDTQPTFRAAIDRCDELLRPMLGGSLARALALAEPAGVAGAGAWADAALFAVEYALAELWRSWGIEPAVVLGDGIGEYVAACVAGVMTLDTGLALAADPAHRAPAGAAFTPTRIPLVSNVTGALWPWDHRPDAAYWCRAERTALCFTTAAATLAGMGPTCLVELGPSATPAAPSGAPADIVVLPGLASGRDDWRVVLSALAELYARGVDIDWCGFDRDYARTRIAVPTYPFMRVHCWYDSPRHHDHAAVGAEPAAAADHHAAGAQAAGAPGSAGALSREGLLALPPEEQFATLAAHLVHGVSTALSSGAGPRRHGRRAGVAHAVVEVGLDQPLFDLGFDSLMAMELKNQVRTRLGVTLPMAALLHGRSIRQLTDQILSRLTAPDPAPAAELAPIQPVSRAGDNAEELLAELDRMSEDEVRKLLDERGTNAEHE
ncbi:MAG TPA: beta-ketoacyl synthase N-terminal-like domain-containing protein [Kofleriaceae bacterium]|nr:beta-ketoacyl synthase N-terminal-like domain-containing protein [Kofleriaceae bacterium]